MTNSLFRKVSVERLASPDQLDQLLHITRPRGWVALAGFGTLLVAGLVWGVAGRIDNRVQAQGILLRSGGVLEIVAPSAGRVTDIRVQVGDSVHAGKLIGLIDQPELNDQMVQARSNLAAARQAYAQALRFAASDSALLTSSLDQQRKNITASIQAIQEQSKSLTQRLEAQEQLLRQGLIALPTLHATRQQFEQVQERERSYRDELQKIDLQSLETQNRRTAALREAQFKQQDGEREVARLESQLKASVEVVSAYDGRILELMTEPGKILTRGEPMLTLDRAGTSKQDLVAVIYVPAMLGKRVQRGMRVQIAPTTVRREEYGMLLGEVTFVSSFPATNKGMQRVLKNDQLIAQLSGGGAPYEVHATLTPDPTTLSRYRWTSAKGPPVLVESGTLAGATIIVGHQMPLSMVLPALNRAPGT